ncbi:unnamed protein product [Cylicocyclus nassatus]|uniref:Major facilitator superfamily (MFS) profile domain-containing protein n=1 Tax=Cylicocyclus nassatus TaxID=53992 RepID=A0AA36GXK1_CYLNA|nr:unnamed protein product [Cylicocyclus nassatus]
MEVRKRSFVRYIILVISLLLITSILCNQQALNFTVICMQDVVDSQAIADPAQRHWLNDAAKKNALFSIVAVGTLIGLAPIVPAMQRIGLRNLLTLYGFMSAFATLFLPLAVDFGHTHVAIARTLQGFSASIVFVSVGAITSQWSIHRQSGRYLAMLSSAGQLSSTITMPVASAFCESSFGWRYLYYVFGTFALFLSLLFFIFYRDDPREHWLISSKEVSAIMCDKQGHSQKETVPYKEILTDRCMQAVLLATFSGNIAFFIFLQFGPTYMNMALGFDISETGYATGLAYAVSILLKFVAGPLYDITTFIPEKYRMIMFATISQGVVSLSFCILSQTTNKLIARIAYSGVIACNGLNIVGVVKCAQVVARQYIHFVIVCMTLIGCMMSFLLPVLVTIICPNNTAEEWSRLFIGLSIFVIATNIPFLLLVEDEPASWTKRTPTYKANLTQGFGTVEDGRNILHEQKTAIN